MEDGEEVECYYEGFDADEYETVSEPVFEELEGGEGEPAGTRSSASSSENPVGARSSAPADASTGGFVMTPERQARLDAKMATMSPEKKAKVEAALKARAAEAAAKAAQSAPAPASLDDDSVGAHSSAPATAGESENASKAQQSFQAPAAMFADEQLESLISLMDEAKAQAVRAALNMKGGE